MPKLSFDEKIKRTTKFLTASGEVPIATLLAQRGFSEEDRQEGWALLDAATGRHLAMPEISGTFQTQYNQVLNKLDEWENVWFDVADAALGRVAKSAHAKLFQNLSKATGGAVLLTVKSFVGRLREIQGDESEEMQQAAAVLAKRGLNEACIAEAEGLVAEIENAQPPADPPTDTTALKIAREQATATMWAWFLDWSKTACTVVKNRNYHVMLGLVSHHGAKAVEVSTDDEDFIVDESSVEAINQSLEAAASGM